METDVHIQYLTEIFSLISVLSIFHFSCNLILFKKVSVDQTSKHFMHVNQIKQRKKSLKVNSYAFQISFLNTRKTQFL